MVPDPGLKNTCPLNAGVPFAATAWPSVLMAKAFTMNGRRPLFVAALPMKTLPFTTIFEL